MAASRPTRSASDRHDGALRLRPSPRRTGSPRGTPRALRRPQHPAGTLPRKDCSSQRPLPRDDQVGPRDPFLEPHRVHHDLDPRTEPRAGEGQEAEPQSTGGARAGLLRTIDAEIAARRRRPDAGAPDRAASTSSGPAPFCGPKTALAPAGPHSGLSTSVTADDLHRHGRHPTPGARRSRPAAAARRRRRADRCAARRGTGRRARRPSRRRRRSWRSRRDTPTASTPPPQAPRPSAPRCRGSSRARDRDDPVRTSVEAGGPCHLDHPDPVADARPRPRPRRRADRSRGVARADRRPAARAPPASPPRRRQAAPDRARHRAARGASRTRSPPPPGERSACRGTCRGPPGRAWPRLYNPARTDREGPERRDDEPRRVGGGRPRRAPATRSHGPVRRPRQLGKGQRGRRLVEPGRHGAPRLRGDTAAAQLLAGQPAEELDVFRAELGTAPFSTDAWNAWTVNRRAEASTRVRPRDVGAGGRVTPGARDAAERRRVARAALPVARRRHRARATWCSRGSSSGSCTARTCVRPTASPRAGSAAGSTGRSTSRSTSASGCCRGRWRRRATTSPGDRSQVDVERGGRRRLALGSRRRRGARRRRRDARRRSIGGRAPQLALVAGRRLSVDDVLDVRDPRDSAATPALAELVLRTDPRLPVATRVTTRRRTRRGTAPNRYLYVVVALQQVERRSRPPRSRGGCPRPTSTMPGASDAPRPIERRVVEVEAVGPSEADRARRQLPADLDEVSRKAPADRNASPSRRKKISMPGTMNTPFGPLAHAVELRRTDRAAARGPRVARGDDPERPGLRLELLGLALDLVAELRGQRLEVAVPRRRQREERGDAVVVGRLLDRRGRARTPPPRAGRTTRRPRASPHRSAVAQSSRPSSDVPQLVDEGRLRLGERDRSQVVGDLGAAEEPERRRRCARTPTAPTCAVVVLAEGEQQMSGVSPNSSQ